METDPKKIQEFGESEYDDEDYYDEEDDPFESSRLARSGIQSVRESVLHEKRSRSPNHNPFSGSAFQGMRAIDVERVDSPMRPRAQTDQLETN